PQRLRQRASRIATLKTWRPSAIQSLAFPEIVTQVGVQSGEHPTMLLLDPLRARYQFLRGCPPIAEIDQYGLLQARAPAQGCRTKSSWGTSLTSEAALGMRNQRNRFDGEMVH